MNASGATAALGPGLPCVQCGHPTRLPAHLQPLLQNGQPPLQNGFDSGALLNERFRSDSRTWTRTSLRTYVWRGVGVGSLRGGWGGWCLEVFFFFFFFGDRRPSETHGR
jgi:hypothetical protein